MDVPYHIKNPDSDLRSGTLEAGNEKRGKTENIKENDRKKRPISYNGNYRYTGRSVYRGIIHLSCDSISVVR